MNFGFSLAQVANPHQGWLTTKLLSVTLTSAEWVLWLLVTLSIISVALMLERLVFFWTNRLPDSERLVAQLARGEFEPVRSTVGMRQGMEAAVVREAIGSASLGADAVEEVIAKTIAQERPRYERFLSFLGTLGNNAPFVGLLGTVLGIIKAFADLGQLGAGKGSTIQQTVMAGISEALVATAVGLAVAIPAVIAFNVFNRSLKTIVQRTNALGHAVLSHLRSDARQPARAAEALREVR